MKLLLSFVAFGVLCCGSLAIASPQTVPHVALQDDALIVDGHDVGMLFGAETQYFRARGGSGRNVDPQVVERVWNKLLDRVQEAHMNSVIFYIPWDFHEPVEGVFDFTGTLDQDGDGKPDYPSRNLRKWFDMLTARGIKNVMVRPGPSINAEWGVEGFGAVPEWFLKNYPDALTGSNSPGRPRTASWNHPVYRDRYSKWFAALYSQVLKDYIGPGKPITMVQLDNETNYFWDSVYERDYNPVSIQRYQAWLQTRHGDIGRVNSTYGSHFSNFSDVQPPRSPNDNTYWSEWHVDWFRFHDAEIREYHWSIRHAWEALGVREPDVIFTTCESYNAFQYGLLPRLDARGDGGLALTTLNIYPKTYGSQAQSTLNTPMKGAHDAVLLASGHRQFNGNGGNWLMSTETVGGWFPPTEVSLATRQHTYGSLLGTGVKALMIYYFHEGYNWNGQEQNDSDLHFDAPLDKDLNATPAFELLKSLGNNLSNGLGADLAHARMVRSPILLAKDTDVQYTTPGLQWTLPIVSTESAAMYGMLREAGYQSDVAFIDRMSESDLNQYKVIVWRNPDYWSAKTMSNLLSFWGRGGHIIVIGALPRELEAHPGVGNIQIDPSYGWNGDDYTRIADAAERVDALRDRLIGLGVNPAVTVRASDGQAFVHGWMRTVESSTPKALLFVENFARTSRNLSVSIRLSAVPEGFSSGHLEAVPRALAAGVRGRSIPVIQTPGPEATMELTLTASPDGVDVWEIRVAP